MIRLSLLLCFLCLAQTAAAQYDIDKASDTTDKKKIAIDPYQLKERIYVGGDLSLSFGNFTYIYVAPMVGYDIHKGLSAGIAPIYQLYRANVGGSSNSFSTYGLGIFGRYRPPLFNFLLTQLEFNLYNTENFTTPASDRINVPSFMAGLGYAGSLGKSYHQIMLFYDLIDNIHHPLYPLFPTVPLYLRYGIVFYLG